MIEHFGTMPDGRDVQRLSLQGDGLRAHVLTLGAIMQDLRLDGVAHPLVLSTPTLDPYLDPMAYFGAMVGRFANRIGGAQFELDGQTHRLGVNCHGRNCLHGGPDGSAHQLWQVQDHAPDRLQMDLHMADGHMGFPGNLDVSLQITIQGTSLQFEVTAESDQPTPCSFAQHNLYALDDTGSIAQHRLRIAADAYLPVDDTLIPTGEIRHVAGSAFDFRDLRSLREVALDHNFCLSGAPGAMRPAAWLESEASGLALEMVTTEPGLQVYTAHGLPRAGVIGPDGAPFGQYAGIALEAQAWPDAPNQPDFPPAILRPGARYHQVTRVMFHRGG
jgi:aldose 1-epimerase